MNEFVPRDFDVPRRLETPRFVFEPLGPEHNDQDHDAPRSSIWSEDIPERWRRPALYDPHVIELRELTEEHHEIAERFWQFFLHDLSGFRDSHPDEHGSFKRRHLEPFLVHDADRVAYLVYGPTGPVGFAFVYGLASEVRRFDQFFIVRSQRRAGVGRAAAEATIRRHPGRWEVAFQNENPTAASFWRRLAAEIGSNVYERLQPVPNKPHIPDDVILSFETA